MEFHSIVEVKEAERQSKIQRLGFACIVWIAETKATSPKDVMLLHRLRVGAADRSLSKQGNPTLKTFLANLNALNAPEKLTDRSQNKRRQAESAPGQNRGDLKF